MHPLNILEKWTKSVREREAGHCYNQLLERFRALAKNRHFPQTLIWTFLRDTLVSGDYRVNTLLQDTAILDEHPSCL